MATLKAILDAMLGSSGFALPSGYAASANPADQQLLHLANEAADDLRELGLCAARRFYEFTLTAATDYALPADFHALVPDTTYGGVLPANIAPSDGEWAWLRASGVGGPEFHARQLGTMLRVLNPEAGTLVQLEYVSNAPWTDAGTQAGKELATADTDEWALDRRALTLGVKWRWKKEKGLPDWQADAQAFGRYIGQLRGRDGGVGTLHFDAGDGMPHGAPHANLWVN